VKVVQVVKASMIVCRVLEIEGLVVNIYSIRFNFIIYFFSFLRVYA
jgi:hypothetical protein